MNYYPGGQGGKRSENDDTLLEQHPKYDFWAGRKGILKGSRFC